MALRYKIRLYSHFHPAMAGSLSSLAPTSTSFCGVRGAKPNKNIFSTPPRLDDRFRALIRGVIQVRSLALAHFEFCPPTPLSSSTRALPTASYAARSSRSLGSETVLWLALAAVNKGVIGSDCKVRSFFTSRNGLETREGCVSANSPRFESRNRNL
jgi:hypothetical protein